MQAKMKGGESKSRNLKLLDVGREEDTKKAAARFSSGFAPGE